MTAHNSLRRLVSVTVGLCCVVGIHFGATNTVAQGGKVIELPKSSIKPIVKIIEAHVAGRKVNLDESFTAPSDWLDHISLKLENASGKTIVYILVDGFLPETASTGQLMDYQLTVGRRPGLNPPANRPMLTFKTGETLDIDFGSQVPLPSRFIASREPIALINKLRLQVTLIVFEDGSAWLLGTPMKQDPSDPRRYIPVEAAPPTTRL